MKTYTAEELKEILKLHKKWINNEDGGTRADLSSANLSYADLSSAIGNMKHIKSLQTETYYITYTSNVIQIGCQRHTIEEWKNFDDETIRKMDSKALEWWTKWKPILMQIIKMAPCEDTKN